MQGCYTREYLPLEALTKMRRREEKENKEEHKVCIAVTSLREFHPCANAAMLLVYNNYYYSLFSDQLAWSSRNNHDQGLHLQKSDCSG